jgi:hypothetical protein
MIVSVLSRGPNCIFPSVTVLRANKREMSMSISFSAIVTEKCSSIGSELGAEMTAFDWLEALRRTR